MSTATAVRTRKSHNTAASLIASEFAASQIKRQVLSDDSIWDEVVLPTPIESHPLAGISTANPVILFLIAFVVVAVLAKVSIAIILVAAKVIKKIAAQVAAFWSAQMGGNVIDFRVYNAIFD